MTDNKDKTFLEGDIGQVELRDINEEMQESYLSYAMSVIVARALPDVRDGLKPVHRRILYAMDTLGLRSNAKYRKSATVVGEVLGKYHPHGDQAVYDSMVRMAQDFSMRYRLVDGQGNFGSIDGDNAAAMRYTESKMMKLTNELLSDIDKDTVDFVPNYDGSQQEPVILPSRVPTLLLNGSEGIAVGMATKIPPHNLTEVIEGVEHLIDNPDATVEDLMKFIKGPDFPTRGVIYDSGDIKAAYGTGKGGVTIRAVADIEEDKKNKFRIVVTELPYQVNKASLIEKISELVKTKKIVGISDLRDESDRKNPVRIVIELKKEAYPNKILNQLYKLTLMQTKFHMNMIALVDQINPRLLTLKMILEEFITHREVVVERRTKFELKKAKDRAHILEGLLIALKNIDAVIKTIKESKDQKVAKVNLMAKFKLTEVQALAILEMQLRTLAGLERKKIEDEYTELQKKIKELEELLASRTKMLNLIKKELDEIKEKYGDERRTKIIKQSLGGFDEEDLIPNEQVVITLTDSNYIKRVISSTYRAQGRGGKGVLGMATKEEDLVKQMDEANNHDFILFFTDQGRVFKIKAYEIPASSRTAKGQPIVNLLQLAPEETVTSFVTVSDINENCFLVMATKDGTVKKTPLSAFENIRKTGIIAIKLDKKDKLQWVDITRGNDDVIIVTETSQAVRFSEKEARPMGRGARGVRGIKLRKDDKVIGMDVIIEGSELVVITENGYGKRTDVKNFPVHHRGGIGIRAGVNTKKTGKTVGSQIITSVEDDLVVISKQGTIIRMPLKNISRIGRATQGVRIMKISDGDCIASISNIPKPKGSIQEGLGLDVDNTKDAKSSKKSTSESLRLPEQHARVGQGARKPSAAISKPARTAGRSGSVRPSGGKKTVKKENKSGFKVKKVSTKSTPKSKSGFKVKKIK